MNARLRLFVPLLLTLGLGALLWLGLGNNPYSQDEAVAGRTLPAWQSDDLLGGAPIHTTALKGGALRAQRLGQLVPQLPRRASAAG